MKATITVVLFAGLGISVSALGQQQDPRIIRTEGAPPQTAVGQYNDQQSPELVTIVDRISAQEMQLERNLRRFSPRVETYIQNFRPDPELGAVPTDDHYFLGRMDFHNGIAVRSFLPQPRLGRRILMDVTNQITRWYSIRYQPQAFAYTIIMDTRHFDRQHYKFEFVRREFLGNVRCLVFDIEPRPRAGVGLFKGRIWAEDQGYNIVRFNGTYAPAPRFSSYFHFDSWRENLQPGLWLPVYVYSEESDLRYAIRRNLRFKSETRLWGYGLSNPNHQEELTRVLVDAPMPVQDNSATAPDPSPISSTRQWESEAEDNVLARLQKAGLLAAPGDADKVLETVVNNLIVTNHLDNLPPVHCRILLTSPLESLAVGNTIIVSRGLIDVLPDEASLAMILSHELAHIVLGHTLTPEDTKYAFDDRLIMPDEDILRRLNFQPSEQEEEAADAKAIQFLKNSPYKDQLGKAGLFLRAMAEAAPRTPELFGTHLGTRLARGNQVRRMASLMTGAPALKPNRIDQIAALPLGARIKLNPWSDSIQFIKSKPPALLSAREKMPFEVTPLFPYLTRYEAEQHAPVEESARQQDVKQAQ